MKIAFALMTLALSLNANAALSGYYDSAKKIETVLSSSEVANSLRQQSITKIEVNDLMVTVESATCARLITLETVAPARGVVGPQQYRVASIYDNPCN